MVIEAVFEDIDLKHKVMTPTCVCMHTACEISYCDAFLFLPKYTSRMYNVGMTQDTTILLWMYMYICNYTVYVCTLQGR